MLVLEERTLPPNGDLQRYHPPLHRNVGPISNGFVRYSLEKVTNFSRLFLLEFVRAYQKGK